MSANLLQTTAATSDIEKHNLDEMQRSLNVFMLFDEDASVRSAEELLRRVASTERCAAARCRFEDLNSQARSLAMARAATEADLLLLAIDRDGELPEHVKSWLFRWLHGRNAARDGALVALMTGGRDPAYNPGVRLYLETVASIGGLAFFAGRALSAGGFVHWIPPSERLARQKPVEGADDRSDLAVPARDWGINE
jgi:hypothetical protein